MTLLLVGAAVVVVVGVGAILLLPAGKPQPSGATHPPQPDREPDVWYLDGRTANDDDFGGPV